MRTPFAHTDNDERRGHRRGQFPGRHGEFDAPHSHHPGPFGPWTGGPGGFGPGGFGPGMPGMPGFGPGGRGRGHRGGGRGRRGDVRTAILALLAERPMHGYEMIKEIARRSDGFWRPSPGSVYPTLQLLADEGLIVSSEGSGSKRLFELTEEGRTEAGKQDSTPPWEQVTNDVDPRDVSLRSAIQQLMGAMFQVGSAASDGQKSRAVDVLNEARRKLYAILSEDEQNVADAE